jgi:NADPH2:quinone reductase
MKEKTMPIAIRFTQTGGLNVLKLETFAEAAPGPGEVWIEQQAIGVNYLDVMQRNGSAPIQLPSGLGLEAAGRVSAIVPGVTNVAVGERVAYILGAIGSYASGRLYPAERLVGLPDGLSANDAAAILFKGITAHYLLHSTYAVGPGTVVLLYGAAGALGQIMARGPSRWAPSSSAWSRRRRASSVRKPSAVMSRSSGAAAIFRRKSRRRRTAKKRTWYTMG